MEQEKTASEFSHFLLQNLSKKIRKKNAFFFAFFIEIISGYISTTYDNCVIF